MNKLIIIGASIAGILGTLDILKTDPLKYGACALLGYTAFMIFNELNPPKQQGARQQTQRPMQTKNPIREKPKSIWDEFPKETTTKEEVKPDETKKELKFKIEDTKIEDTNEEQDKIQNPEKMQEA